MCNIFFFSHFRLREPCQGCAAPYGFKNHMQLSTDTSKFTEEVAETRISGNLDAPEGGFDAVMQSIVCKDKIGWREKSRKLLVFSTDSGFHYAGDGKVGVTYFLSLFAAFPFDF